MIDVALLSVIRRWRLRDGMAHRLAHADVVVLDELGYLPFSQAGGALLFHLLNKLYERTSIIITTNLILGVVQCVR